MPLKFIFEACQSHGTRQKNGRLVWVQARDVSFVTVG
jgi:hypothetical protein